MEIVITLAVILLLSPKLLNFIWISLNLPLLILHELYHYIMALLWYCLLPHHYTKLPRIRICKFTRNSISMGVETEFFAEKGFIYLLASVLISTAPLLLYITLPVMFPQIIPIMMIELMFCIRKEDTPTLWLSIDDVDMIKRSIERFKS